MRVLVFETVFDDFVVRGATIRGGGVLRSRRRCGRRDEMTSTAGVGFGTDMALGAVPHSRQPKKWSGQKLPSGKRSRSRWWRPGDRW